MSRLRPKLAFRSSVTLSVIRNFFLKSESMRFDRQDDESARTLRLFILLHVRYSLSLKLLSPNKFRGNSQIRMFWKQIGEL